MFFPRLFIIVILSATVFLSSCGDRNGRFDTGLISNPKSATGEKTDARMPVIEFTRTEYDFGRLIQGEKATYSFRYKNTGNSDLVLTKVSASCGCTASNYSRAPLKPGEEGKIDVVFDSNGLRGIQNKTVTVLTNTTPSTTVLRVKAQVVAP